MTRIALILCSVFLFACASPQKSEKEKVDSSSVDSTESAESSLEIIDPNSLDLSLDQVFMDTTRSSSFYRQIKAWKESKFDIGSYEASLKEINKDFKPVSIKLKGFPTHFISLRKLNGDFVLYDRCDGINQRYEIRDSVFIYYGPLESDAESIARLVKLEKDYLAFEVRVHPVKTGNKISLISIEKVTDFVYLLKYQNEGDAWQKFVTTPEGISHFDLVVNHCVTQKQLEYDGFDEE